MKRIAVLAAGMFLCAVAFAQNTLFSFEFEEIAEDVWVGVRRKPQYFKVSAFAPKLVWQGICGSQVNLDFGMLGVKCTQSRCQPKRRD